MKNEDSYHSAGCKGLEATSRDGAQTPARFITQLHTNSELLHILDEFIIIMKGISSNALKTVLLT